MKNPINKTIVEGQLSFDRGDYDKALKCWEPLAKKGNVKAQCSLGLLYSEDKWTKKNDETAVEWFRQAAKEGHAPSQYYLGVAYRRDKGVMRDDETALVWFIVASLNGYNGDRLGVENDLFPGQIKDAEDLAKRCWISNLDDNVCPGLK